MGVPLLLTWLRRRFSDCFSSAEDFKEPIDCLYIDLNALLYQSATIVTSGRPPTVRPPLQEVEDAVLRILVELLDDIVFTLVRPTSLVYIAVDGISPLGKMEQQRTRRRRSGYRAAKLKELWGWDTNCISVGTPFMTRVTDTLHFYAVSRVELVNRERLESQWVSRTASQTASTAADVPSSGLGGEEDSTAAPSADGAAAAQLEPKARPPQPLCIIVDDVTRAGEGENKILDAIRRLRAQPNYDVKTTYAICSSDTDVIVCSLLLHEPHIHILRYEPPESYVRPQPLRTGGAIHGSAPLSRPSAPGGPSHLHQASSSSPLGRPPATALHPPTRPPGGGGHLIAPKLPGARVPPTQALGGRRPLQPFQPKPMHHTKFFNMERFRAHLCKELGSPTDCNVFAHSLHDVVFTLLLFGNDFLPAVGGSIEDGGMLDKLLSVLATDFVAHGRTIVDPYTNRICFDAASHALGCVAKLKDGRATKEGGDGLQIFIGDPNPVAELGKPGEEDDDVEDPGNWGFTSAPSAGDGASARSKASRAAQKCYSYWTMLQWALLYCVGEVQHWRCYYPYPTAPSPRLLEKHCGVFPCAALSPYSSQYISRASPITDPGVLDQLVKRGALIHAGEPLGPSEEDSSSSLPIDVVVQLLFLLPPTSIDLLPTIMRMHYKEIESAVQQPVDKIDVPRISEWCSRKGTQMTEAERLRLEGYRYFAQTVAGVRGMDTAFAAFWEPEVLNGKLTLTDADDETPNAPVRSDGVDAERLVRPAGGEHGEEPPPRPARVAERIEADPHAAVKFFATDLMPVTGDSTARSPGCGKILDLLSALDLNATAAAATALLRTATEHRMRRNESACREGVHGEATAAVETVECVTETIGTSAAAADGSATELVRCTEFRGQGYTLSVAPIEAMANARLEQAAGFVQGTRFRCAQYSLPLLRDPASMRLLLRWKLVLKPEAPSTFFPALPPSLPDVANLEVATPSRVGDAATAAGGQRKRPRGDSATDGDADDDRYSVFSYSDYENSGDASACGSDGDNDAMRPSEATHATGTHSVGAATSLPDT